MNRYSEFKNTLKCKSNELEQITGYTRQGLRFAFNKIDAGIEPQDKFVNCINAAVDKKLQEEELRHQIRVQELKKLYIGKSDNVISFERREI